MPVSSRLVAFAAVLDACVLYPVGVRDLLLSVAERGVYVPRWTPTILDEMAKNIVEDGRATMDQVTAMRAQMERAFPDAAVRGYEPLVAAMTNHPKDRHVLAAAVRADIGLIVTDDVDGFDEAARAPYEIDVQTADEFLSYALDHDPPSVIGAVQAMATKRRRPPVTARQLVMSLSERLPVFGSEILPRIDETRS